MGTNELPMLKEPPVWKDEKGRVFNPYEPLHGRSTKGKVHTRYFTVEGQGGFPADMLRYDQAWAVTGLGEPGDALHPRRFIVLATRQRKGEHYPPTVGRWESFGWRVVNKSIHYNEVQQIVGYSAIWTGYCQRCGDRSKANTPSVFNCQTLCLDCAGKERAHPDFKEARNQMEGAEKRGDRTFLGIGWHGDSS